MSPGDGAPWGLPGLGRGLGLGAKPITLEDVKHQQAAKIATKELVHLSMAISRLPGDMPMMDSPEAEEVLRRAVRALIIAGQPIPENMRGLLPWGRE